MRRLFLFLLLSLICCKPALSQPDKDRQLMDSLLQVAGQLLQAHDSMRLPRADSPAAQPSEAPKRYVLSGTITDKNTGEGIPFATVFIPGTGIGTAADPDGNFEFTVDAESLPVDTLYVQSIGYATYGQFIDRSKPQQHFDIALIREAASLGEFVFRAGEDPALVLLKKIIRHKPQNNYDNLPAYRYEAYNKLEVDLQHLSKKQFEQLPIPMIRKFSFIYNNVDSSETTPFLPFYLTESLSDYFYQRSPKKTREIIKASQIKGISNESITRYLGAMQQQLNVYENFLLVFDKNFISPIADNGPFYYRYKITDTQTVYGREVYQVSFRPRREGENCFYGEFWVADSSFALQHITMELPQSANINFVNNVSLYQEFQPLGDTLWFLKKEKFISDFTLPYGSKLPGFIGRKTTLYRHVAINDSATRAVLHDPLFKDNIRVMADARSKDETYWQSNRHEPLSKNEQAIYGMIDTLESLPSFQRFKGLMKFVITGNLEAGPLEIGPYYYFYSRNPVEGNRFRLTLGTTPKLFKDAYLNGYVAYGDKDQEFKYQLGALWLLNRQPRSYLFAQYTHDINRKPGNPTQIADDNIFSRLARKPGIPFKLGMEDLGRIEYYREYFSGFSHQLYGQYRHFEPNAPLPSAGIFFDQEGAPANGLISNEVGVKLRYAWRENFVAGNYYRYSLGSKYPVVELTAGAGFKGPLQGSYDYQRLVLTVQDEAKIANLGKLDYALFAGKIFGTVPYPLLEIHRGNEYYYYNKAAFSMMNDYEFISDQWAGGYLEHNFTGVFKYIPLLKKARLRQFWTAKGVIGSLSPANQTLNLDKGFPFRTLAGNPYLELGTGVSNILQILRVDFVWRVTPRPLPEEHRDSYFGIFGSMQFKF